MTLRVLRRDSRGRPSLAWGSDIERANAAANGFQVIVLTASGIQDPGHRLETRGLKVIRCGYEDNRDLAQAQAAVLRCAPDVAREIERGKRVLIVCAAGENRSALMMARALWLTTGEAGESIVRHMRAIAQLTCPGDVDGCTFTNGLFRRWAQTWPEHTVDEATPTVWPTVAKVAAGVAGIGVALWALKKWI